MLRCAIAAIQMLTLSSQCYSTATKFSNLDWNARKCVNKHSSLGHYDSVKVNPGSLCGRGQTSGVDQ
jgi:hypothetical protein